MNNNAVRSLHSFSFSFSFSRSMLFKKILPKRTAESYREETEAISEGLCIDAMLASHPFPERESGGEKDVEYSSIWQNVVLCCSRLFKVVQDCLRNSIKRSINLPKGHRNITRTKFCPLFCSSPRNKNNTTRTEFCLILCRFSAQQKQHYAH